jgi:hypothetical protein
MLSTFAKPGLLAQATNNNTVITLDRAPHCTWIFSRHDAPADFCPNFGPSSSSIPNYNCSCFAISTYGGKEPFHDRVDGTAHLILAYDRAADEVTAKRYYPMIEGYLQTYFGDGALPATGPYFDEDLRLV